MYLSRLLVVMFHRFPPLWMHAQILTNKQTHIIRTACRADRLTLPPPLPDITYRTSQVKRCARRWIVSITQPEAETDTTPGLSRITLDVLTGYTGSWLVSFIPPCTHMILLKIVGCRILRLIPIQIIAPGNDNRNGFCRCGTARWIVKAGIWIITQVPDQRPGAVRCQANRQRMLTTIQFLIKLIYFCHDRIHIGGCLHIDHHFMRTICIVHKSYLIHILQCESQKQDSHY